MLEQPVNLRPRASVLESIVSPFIYLPLNGGGGAAINVQGVTKARHAIVTLASTPACLIGQHVKLASVGGMTEINGVHKVLQKLSSNRLMLDVDSRNFTTYTSGGTCAFDQARDLGGTLGDLTINGTLTNIWSASRGVNTAGTNNDIYTGSTEAMEFFNLRTLDGVGSMLISFFINIVQAPNGEEFALGFSTGSTVPDGGYGISITTGNVGRVRISESTFPAVLLTASSFTTGEHSVGVWFDCINKVAHLYRAGNLLVSGALPTLLPAGNLATSGGLSLMGRGTNTGSTARLSSAGTPSNSIFGHFWAMRYTGDASAFAGMAFKQQAAYKFALPEALRGR